jgi:hypothetical protein
MVESWCRVEGHVYADGGENERYPHGVGGSSGGSVGYSAEHPTTLEMKLGFPVELAGILG